MIFENKYDEYDDEYADDEYDNDDYEYDYE